MSQISSRANSLLRNRRALLGLLGAAMAVWALLAQAAAADISRFVGNYSGSVEVVRPDGASAPRDMSVSIRETRKGFAVRWTSVTTKKDGRRKEKTYEIEFLPSGREGIFAAAMERNVFGHTVQMDPMEGEPYVWSRITDNTLTVFSMFIAPNGDYEMQQYDRTLADGGLDLTFTSHRNGRPTRELSTFLKRD